jgi:hypothetical protein
MANYRNGMNGQDGGKHNTGWVPIEELGARTHMHFSGGKKSS